MARKSLFSIRYEVFIFEIAPYGGKEFVTKEKRNGWLVGVADKGLLYMRLNFLEEIIAFVFFCFTAIRGEER